LCRHALDFLFVRIELDMHDTFFARGLHLVERMDELVRNRR